ncbi:hypothetical protein [Cetobacterium sp.]|uniref:hypothetical protein n=1 Tax=Cetobacterium sp. TaxID=2071632 RepID=UPI003F3B9E33
MKKLLLVGLLVLSAVGMAATESTQVEVETKLNLTGNSIIITPDENDGTAAMNSVTINHGSQDAASLPAAGLSTKGESPLFVKTTSGTLPAGTQVLVTLSPEETDNKLTNGTNTIAHSLKGTISNVKETNSSVTIVGANTTKSTATVTQAEGDSAIRIDMLSTIAAEELKGKSNGDYKNISLLSVQVTAN